MRSKLPLLTLFILIATAIVFGQALAQRPIAAPKNTEQPPEGGYGLMPPPMDLSHIKAIPGRVWGTASSWDWRALGGTTSVKNQNPFGTCWTFAAIGNFESLVLINEGVSNDFSEYNIQGCNPVSQDCNYGGNAWMSTNYLALLGTVEESCDPYPGACPTSTCINPGCAFGKQVTEWRYLPNDVSAIKAAVQAYGPVYTSMYAGFPGFSTYDGTTCLTYTGTQSPNHGVLIVGWDDAMCSGNGAWIIKNSWGAAWGDNGYFYIQYGHARVGTNANVICGYKDFDPDETIYYYDEWGWWGAVGFGDGNDWGMIELTPASPDEFLYSIDFWATNGPTAYSLYVYNTFSGGALSDLLAGPVSGTVTEAGYYSIDLPAPLSLSVGDPIYLVADLNTTPYTYPVPYDDSGPMETNKCFISDEGIAWTALDNGYYGMGDIGIRGRVGPEIVAGTCIKDGDPAFFVGFSAGTEQVIRGETWCEELAPANFGFVSGTCTDMDTFCNHYSDLLGWTIEGVIDPEGDAYTLNSGSYHWSNVCITVPCDASIGATNTLTAVMAFTDVNGVCAPGCGDCEDPNFYSGNKYSTTTKDFEVVTSPPALYIICDSLYLVERGQTAAYIPFSICNGDPCAPATTYDYVLSSVGVPYRIPAIYQTGSAEHVPGGECATIYGIIDAGDAEVCDYDTLTLISWPYSVAIYDTCIKAVHVIEPMPVPIFTMPVMLLVVLAMILAAAAIMKRASAKRT